MTRINPSPPTGRYPHLRLCGHAGTAPSSINTRITIRIVINQNHLALHPMLECEKLEGVGWEGAVSNQQSAQNKNFTAKYAKYAKKGK